MHQFKLYLLGVGSGLLLAGYIVLTWNAHETFREYYAPTRELENDKRPGYSRKYTTTNFKP